MKLTELQKVFHPLQNVSVIYRDPTHSLATSEIFKGPFKGLSDNIILQRNVAVCKAVCGILYIEIF